MNAQLLLLLAGLGLVLIASARAVSPSPGAEGTRSGVSVSAARSTWDGERPSLACQ